MNKPLILLQNVSLSLQGRAGQVDILKGLNLRLYLGQTVSLLGPSGSGKTTTLMVIAGLERPSAGKVIVAGQDLGLLDEDGLARFRREQMGIVFQAFHLVPTMTALENAALPLEFAGYANAWERAASALESVGLGHRKNHYPSQLSGGEQQRVALARAFAPEPKLLLADEPTGNLDQDTGTMVMDLLFEMQAKNNSTLLLITHDHKLASRCSKSLVMGSGEFRDYIEGDGE